MAHLRTARLRGYRTADVAYPYEPPEQPGWYYDPRRLCSPAKGKSGLFTSESIAERNEAVRLCRRCPFVTECLGRAIDLRIKHYVWGAVDFSREKEPVTDITVAGEVPTTPLDERVKARYEAGLTDAAIAQALGVAPSTVWNSRKRQGLPALFGASGKRLAEVTS